MVNGNGSVAGHRGLRGQGLLEGKKFQTITAKELAARFGVSANAVRRHLKELELEGLVRFGREQQALGAPAFAYRLTDQGEAQFPNDYRDALTELLRHVAQKTGRGAGLEMFQGRYSQLTERLKVELALAPAE